MVKTLLELSLRKSLEYDIIKYNNSDGKAGVDYPMDVYERHLKNNVETYGWYDEGYCMEAIEVNARNIINIRKDSIELYTTGLRCLVRNMVYSCHDKMCDNAILLYVMLSWVKHSCPNIYLKLVEGNREYLDIAMRELADEPFLRSLLEEKIEI